MKKSFFVVLISLCIIIQVCFGAIVTIIEKDISYSFTKTPGNKVSIEAKSSEINGWSVQSGGVILDENNSFIMPENDVKIRALYSEPTEFLLSVEKFGETTRELKSEGDLITVSVTSNEKYIFTEWSAIGITLTDSQKTSESITFTMPNNTVKLVTNYKEVYTIEYNVNGGSGSISSQKKTQGTPLTLSSTVPTKEGYNFLGWSTSSLATTATYQAGGNFTVDANTTLYAVWEIKTRSLTVQLPSGTNRVDKSVGANVTVEVEAAETGYVFVNWTATGITLTPEEQTSQIITFVMPDNDVTIVGNYKAIYTISYDANGGSGAPNSQTKMQGTDIILSTTIPVRSGYNFLGWDVSNTAIAATYQAGGNFTTDANTILYAVWGSQKYTLTVQTPFSTTAEEKTIKEEVTVSTPVSNSEYRFINWTATGITLTAEQQTNTSITFTMPANAVTLVANYEMIYTVSYDANGGFGAPSSQIKSKGLDLTLSDTIPIRDGYKFLGWNTSNLATTAIYGAGGIFSVDENTTLYAIWEELSITNVEVGAYIAYKPSKTSCTVLADDSGHTSNQTYNPSSITSWRVLYNNDGQLDIVSTESVGDLTLKGATGYAKAVDTLNNMCNEYVNPIYANSGRSIGANESSMGTIDTSTYPLTFSYTYTEGNHSFPYVDTYYATDYNQIKDNNLVQSSGDVWLASRRWESDGTVANFFVRKLKSDGNVLYNAIFYSYSTDSTSDNSSTFGVRPVISLKPEVAIIGGDGTSTNPYIINEKHLLTVELPKYTLIEKKEEGVTITVNTDEIVEGKAFSNWTVTGITLTESERTSPSITFTMPANEVTLVSNYEMMYTVSYDANGGSGAPSSQIKSKGLDLTLSDTVPIRDGYKFLGWNTDNLATTAIYGAGGIFSVDENTTLYAIWEETASSSSAPYTITTIEDEGANIEGVYINHRCSECGGTDHECEVINIMIEAGNANVTEI